MTVPCGPFAGHLCGRPPGAPYKVCLFSHFILPFAFNISASEQAVYDWYGDWATDKHIVCLRTISDK
jgi:hypothetical protein